MSGFKNFIMRGNLVQLAVAVVIGTQCSDLVKQFVQSFVNPLLSLACASRIRRAAARSPFHVRGAPSYP